MCERVRVIVCVRTGRGSCRALVCASLNSDSPYLFMVLRGPVAHYEVCASARARALWRTRAALCLPSRPSVTALCHGPLFTVTALCHGPLFTVTALCHSPLFTVTALTPPPPPPPLMAGWAAPAGAVAAGSDDLTQFPASVDCFRRQTRTYLVSFHGPAG